MGHLEQHADPGLVGQLPASWDAARHATGEGQLAAAHAAALGVAAAMPRRLGGGATAAQLAADKRQARRMAHAVAQAASEWGATVPGQVSAEAQRMGAQLDLAVWHAERLAYLRARRTWVATVCVHLGKREIGNRYVQRYTNEINRLQWAVR